MIPQQTDKTGTSGKKISILQYFDKSVNNELPFTDSLSPPQTRTTYVLEKNINILQDSSKQVDNITTLGDEIKFPPRTIRSYTIERKIKTLEALDKSNDDVQTFAEKIKMPARTLQDWNNQRDQIFTADKKNLKKRKIGSGNKPILGDIFEAELMKWILHIRSRGVAVTDELVICKAECLIEKIDPPINCKFSNGWINNFKRRHNIVLRKAGSKIIRISDCDKKILTNFVSLVNTKIASKRYSSIINIDETGLHYDPTINFTLAVGGTKRVEIKTTGRDKQRVTIVLGIDLLDRIKMKPFIIMKGKTERCLKDIPFSESYNLSFQENSWCTDYQFIKFLSALPTDKKILLIYDNFGGHKTDNVTNFLKKHLPLVEVLLLPPNTTSILQPLDVGINKSFKSHIRKKYLKWVIENIDRHNEFPYLGKIERNKLLVNWVSESWNCIGNSMIKDSFNFCGYGIPDKVHQKWEDFCDM